ncbi:MAG: fibronectin type III domain-containing protein [Verrucomicrobiota bacterium]
MVWDANPEPNIAGYRLHLGVGSGTYDTVIDVGEDTEFFLSQLNEEYRYYIAITAYNSFGIESGFSRELIVSAAGFDPRPALTVTGFSRGEGGVLNFDLLGGDDLPSKFEVQVSEDLVHWSYLQSVRAVGESFTIIDPLAAVRPKRFYRLNDGTSGSLVPKLSVTRLVRGAGGNVSFQLSGGDGFPKDVRVYASEDLKSWTLLQIVERVSSSLTIQDPLAATQSRRFYRLEYPD